MDGEMLISVFLIFLIVFLLAFVYLWLLYMISDITDGK